MSLKRKNCRGFAFFRHIFIKTPSPIKTRSGWDKGRPEEPKQTSTLFILLALISVCSEKKKLVFKFWKLSNNQFSSLRQNLLKWSTITATQPEKQKTIEKAETKIVNSASDSLQKTCFRKESFPAKKSILTKGNGSLNRIRKQINQ